MSNERVETLTVAQCRELLDRHHFGRFGFVDAVGVLPSIVPVNYVSASANGDANFGARQCRCVVDAIAHHRDLVSMRACGSAIVESL
jgi:nitroimidazol reductase NimA-like FMN-containing flavoprotein (pyridoxamine 5'-phosphate oxidase superfamily)